ncbi:hypothetical protein JTE90_010215 [Oedothorax gibbosus]|uniref:Uncharacterized protein n=1 Tax=Oedothorax gibbosus TaxID=931172 RepID=A0AAV6UIG7_9ARAC|nr:hypothetical protein JTE90_010215 [Oedothorax gibbosus]
MADFRTTIACFTKTDKKKKKIFIPYFIEDDDPNVKLTGFAKLSDSFTEVTTNGDSQSENSEDSDLSKNDKRHSSENGGQFFTKTDKTSVVKERRKKKIIIPYFVGDDEPIVQLTGFAKLSDSFTELTTNGDSQSENSEKSDSDLSENGKRHRFLPKFFTKTDKTSMVKERRKKKDIIPYEVGRDEPNVKPKRYRKLSDEEMENLPSESDFFPGIKWIIPNYKVEDFESSEWYHLPGRRRE